MSSSAHRVFSLFAVALFAIALPARAQNGETQSKASLVYTIARNSTWPKAKMGAGTPFVIGVFARDAMRDSLIELTGSRQFMGRDVLVKRLDNVQEIASCHILFIGGSEQDRLGTLLSKARSADVLTIGESENFLSKGGHFVLYENGRMRFEYDRRNLKRIDVKVSPDLLFMAEPRLASK